MYVCIIYLFSSSRSHPLYFILIKLTTLSVKNFYLFKHREKNSHQIKNKIIFIIIIFQFLLYRINISKKLFTIIFYYLIFKFIKWIQFIKYIININIIDFCISYDKIRKLINKLNKSNPVKMLLPEHHSDFQVLNKKYINILFLRLTLLNTLIYL